MSDIKENERSDIQIEDNILEQILDDARPYLKKSLHDWITEKSIEIQKKYFNDDPFQLRFDTFINLSIDEQRNWRHRILKEKKDWLSKQIAANKAEWLLIIGGKIEFASPSINELPKKEKIYQLAQLKGFAPFIFVKDPLIEEIKNDVDRTNWAVLEHNDFYPTIKFFIGTNNLEDEELIDPRNEIVADFDTGSPVIIIDQDELKKRNISVEEEIEISHIHLGIAYEFYLPEIKIGIETINNSIKSKAFRIRSVMNWEKSPFRIVNPNRKGLVGRNLLLELDLHVILKGDEKCTEILQ